MTRPRLAKKARLKWDSRDERHMLLYPERGLALSETAAAIASLCDGTRTLEEIATELAARYPGAAPEVLRADVASFIGDLRRRGLID